MVVITIMVTMVRGTRIRIMTVVLIIKFMTEIQTAKCCNGLRCCNTRLTLTCNAVIYVCLRIAFAKQYPSTSKQYFIVCNIAFTTLALAAMTYIANMVYGKIGKLMDRSNESKMQDNSLFATEACNISGISLSHICFMIF